LIGIVVTPPLEPLVAELEELDELDAPVPAPVEVDEPPAPAVVPEVLPAVCCVLPLLPQPAARTRLRAGSAPRRKRSFMRGHYTETSGRGPVDERGVDRGFVHRDAPQQRLGAGMQRTSLAAQRMRVARHVARGSRAPTLAGRPPR
jgi:hypothetical protein